MLSKNKPDFPCQCDSNTCESRNEPIYQLACHHTFHSHCLPHNGSCSICTGVVGGTRRQIQAAHAPNVSPRIPVTPITTLPRVTIDPTTYGKVTCWHFFPGHSQSTILGRNASNGAVFIVLTLCRLLLCSSEIPDPNRPLSQSWIYRVIRAILIGNKFCDRISQGEPGTFGVCAAIRKIGDILGGIDILQEPKESDTATAASLLGKVEPQTTLVCNFGEKKIACFCTSEHILLLDSHSHGQTGAFVALASRADALKLLRWYKALNNLETVQGSFTLVSFKATNHVAAANLYPQEGNESYRGKVTAV